ncbi:HEAT repeat domain-containing protein [Promethearchaeum syntrophicum]|uniref:HEAT repeat domain-containing protein n=1 Tax=Promethearchaeum syntrophicum TaxID=2594042 RepID=A0A5B9DAK6_9ARCH|nr:HEAT repeat domain-containing protein [Candidatus Prometheoarchaeum syntrophicum]QEE16154.1 PBS lyase HEAT-like repeat protein [Candidatus Prometheoarchaeum syntrophicum]
MSDPNTNPSSDQSQAPKSPKESKLDQQLKKLTSRKFRIQNDAINELGKIKDPQAKIKLTEIARSKEWDSQLRVTAISSLGRGQKNKNLMDLLIALANDKTNDREIRRACITLLSRYRDIKILDTFSQSLDDEYRFIRFWAIRGLIKLRDKKATPALIKGLGDSDEEIRKEVRSHLEMLGDEAVPDMITAFTEHNDKKFLRYGVVGMLGRLNHPKVLQFLLERLNDEEDRLVTIALRGISKQVNPKSIEPLLTLYISKKDKRRLIEDALFRIGQSYSKLLVEKIIVKLKNQNEDIVTLVTNLFGKLPECVSYLKNYLKDSELNEELKTTINSILTKFEKK